MQPTRDRPRPDRRTTIRRLEGRLAEGLGIVGQPVAVLALTSTVLCLALSAVVVGLRMPFELPAGDDLTLAGRLGIAVLL
ncbi:MAG TPA: hypothetical protein VFO77_08515, partial [Actinoplanes sp.]|nr:hypothetical protein [Actinoplanes sp.]